LNSPGEQIYR